MTSDLKIEILYNYIKIEKKPGSPASVFDIVNVLKKQNENPKKDINASQG